MASQVLVLNDDGTDPQTMAKVFSAIDQAVDELGTGKKIGVYTQITPQGLESGNNALNAFSEEGYAPDFLLADLQGTTVSGDYTQLLNDVSAATEGRCDLITVHNMNLISADSGADGKLYADPYEPAYQIYENRGHSIRGTAIEGYSALRSSKYYLMDLMNSLYDSNYDICPYELTVEPGFGSTLQSDTFTTSSAKYFISVISDPDQPLYLNSVLLIAFAVSRCILVPGLRVISFRILVLLVLLVLIELFHEALDLSCLGLALDVDLETGKTGCQSGVLSFLTDGQGQLIIRNNHLGCLLLRHPPVPRSPSPGLKRSRSAGPGSRSS